MAYLTKKQLLDGAAKGITEEDVEITAGTVKVRSLTGAEASLVTQGAILIRPGRDTKFSADVRQKLILQYGIVEPRLEAADVATFVATCKAGDVDKLVEKIDELSGTSQDDAEEAAAAFPEPVE